MKNKKIKRLLSSWYGGDWVYVCSYHQNKQITVTATGKGHTIGMFFWSFGFRDVVTVK